MFAIYKLKDRKWEYFDGPFATRHEAKKECDKLNNERAKTIAGLSYAYKVAKF